RAQRPACFASWFRLLLLIVNVRSLRYFKTSLLSSLLALFCALQAVQLSSGPGGSNVVIDMLDNRTVVPYPDDKLVRARIPLFPAGSARHHRKSFDKDLSRRRFKFDLARLETQRDAVPFDALDLLRQDTHGFAIDHRCQQGLDHFLYDVRIPGRDVAEQLREKEGPCLLVIAVAVAT